MIFWGIIRAAERLWAVGKSLWCVLYYRVVPHMSWPLSHVGGKCPRLLGVQGSRSESGAALAGLWGPRTPALRRGGTGLVALGGCGLTWTPPPTFPLLAQALRCWVWGARCVSASPLPAALMRAVTEGTVPRSSVGAGPGGPRVGSAGEPLGALPYSGFRTLSHHRVPWLSKFPETTWVCY